MCCCLFGWLQNNRCAVWCCDWAETCCPILKCNSVFGMAWLHLFSVIFLLFSCGLALSAHPSDTKYNENLPKKLIEFKNLTSQFVNVTLRVAELDYLVDRWYGMFIVVEGRGTFHLAFIAVSFVVCCLNLLFYLMVLPILCRNCFCGKDGSNYYKHDWPWFKGKKGFVFTGIIGLITLVLFVIVICETVDVLTTEMNYEEHFPFCMRDRYFLKRFCLVSIHEMDHGEDFCEEMITAVRQSYLCHQYREKMAACYLAGIVAVFHLIMTIGYAQMAYRPWAWLKLHKKLKNDADMKKTMKARRKRLHEGLEPKLKIEQERKKVKQAQIQSRQILIEKEKRRLEEEIKIKNKSRRIERRASRKLRQQKTRAERQRRRLEKKNKKNNKNFKPGKPVEMMTAKEKHKYELQKAKNIEKKKQEKAKKREKKKKEKLEKKKTEEKKVRKEIEKSRKNEEKKRRKEHLKWLKDQEKKKKEKEKKWREKEKAMKKEKEKQLKLQEKQKKQSIKNDQKTSKQRAKENWKRLSQKAIARKKNSK